jgi:lipooligosaccharide transport system ATP-binding protein
MEEASQLCDRVIVMDGGTILLEGSPQDLVEREVGPTVVEAWNYGEDFLQFLHGLSGRVEEVGNRLYYYPQEDHVERLFDQRFPHQERLIRRATLEDVFLKLTGRALRD